MKKIILFILPAFFVACNIQKQENNCIITNEDLSILHLTKERSAPDTVEKYLNYYIKKYNLPIKADNIPDGEYYGESPYDDYGYKHIINLKIKNCKFIEIRYDEIKADGHSKTEDTSYCRKMNEHIAGTAPNFSYPFYENELLEKQNLTDIDAISGATYSLYRFQYAVIKALHK